MSDQPNEGRLTAETRRQIKVNLEEHFKESGNFKSAMGSLEACMELFSVMDKDRTKYPLTQIQRDAVATTLRHVGRCAYELAERLTTEGKT